MKKLTIFTPTYNRAYILGKLYESLINQTCKEFIWLIVDDGSKDNTKELVTGWIKENKIEIKYIFQTNGGKMRAHNTGVKNCETELFLCVDSDDYIVENAVDIILKVSDKLLDRDDLSAIVGYKGLSDIKVIGNEFPNNIKESALNDLYRKGFKGDTSLIFKTEVLKNYLFPEIEGEKFITENYIYSQIDEKYKMLLLPKIIIVCNYLDDGYTKNAIKLILNNPIGSMMAYNQTIKLSKGLKEKAKAVIRYTGFGNLAKQKNLYKNCNAKLLYILLHPLSMIYYLKKKKLVKNNTYSL